MSSTEVEEKNQTNTPTEGQPGETEKKNDDASTDAEPQNPNNKEATMADKEEKIVEDLIEDLESDQVDGEGAGETKAPENSENTADETEETGETTDQETTEETGYAPGVTPEPQDENQADLSILPNPVEVSRISVPVDDDQGQYIDDQDGFKQVQDFIAANKDKKDSELKNTELLESGTQLALKFDDKVELQAAISLGKINKYRLTQGMILNILQASFYAINADDKNASWMKYYAASDFKFSLSSAEKYMKLAAIPNIIRWAFLGLERLESIYTVIKDTEYMKKSDPVGAFFQDANIAINFQEEDLEKWRSSIDGAVFNKKIVKHFEKKNEKLPEDKKVEDTVDRSMIHELISGGKQCNPSLISDLYLFAKGGADPNVLLNDLLETGANKLSDSFKGTLTDIKTLEGFPKLISELKSKVTYLSKHTVLIKEITPQHVKDLQAQVTALKALIKAQDTSK